MYKLQKDKDTGKDYAIKRIFDSAVIPFDLANTDYADFKRLVLSGEAELQDADGVLMSAEQAQDYVKELP